MLGTLVKRPVPISVLVVCLCLAASFLMSSSSKMSPIKNVVVAGGSGNLGQFIVSELVAAGFSVTALTRESSSATFPDGVAVKKVDYTSVHSLKAALENQDAVVSALGTMAVGSQTPLVQAAVAARVRRFVPSEFGVNTRKAQGMPIGKILASKINTVDYLDQKAKENPAFSWTGLSIGLFFDFGLEKNFLGFDKATKTATIFDSGNEPFQATNLPFVGRAVAAILRHPEETANRYLEIASFTPTQNEMLKICEEKTGAKWSVKHVSSAELQKTGEEKLGKGDFSAFGDLVRVWQYADGIGNAPSSETIKMLGLGEEDVRATLKKWLSS